VAEAVFHKYFDLGDRALANITLPSGERVLLTIVPNGFAVHRLHLWGVIPGRCLFGVNDFGAKQMAKVLARDAQHLPLLPRANKHQEASATQASTSGPADALGSERPLSLFTRLALTAKDGEDLVRLLERTRNTVG
jgi:hypothetical protein